MSNDQEYFYALALVVEAKVSLPQRLRREMRTVWIGKAIRHHQRPPFSRRTEGGGGGNATVRERTLDIRSASIMRRDGCG